VPEFRPVVKRAVNYLKHEMSRSGLIGYDPSVPASLLDHALATMALCEAYDVSKDFTLRHSAQQASDALAFGMAKNGGWGWAPRAARANTLATTYGVLAMKAAKHAGLQVADKDLEKDLEAARTVLASATGPHGLTGYRTVGDGVSVTLGDASEAPSVPLLTAGATLARIFAGDDRSSQEIQRSVAVLSEHVPARERPEPAYWYLGTYAMFQATALGSQAWQDWDGALRPVILELQVKDGDQLGSWEPAGILGALGGRAATTAECLLALEIYYRYERVRDAKRTQEGR
jgi:hypothetical protein